MKKSSKDSVKLIAMGDQHCGHVVGLTHPDFNYSSNKRSPIENKFKRIREECYNFYAGELKAIGTPDIVLSNGDAIDGPGAKSGGTELLTTDMESQINMVKASYEETRCNNIHLTYGTAYHVSLMGQDFEKSLVDGKSVKKIGSHEFISVKGHTFDAKHHCGSSSIPSGRSKAISNAMVWNMLWNGDNGMQPLADVTLRSHVHYYEGRATWYNGRERKGYTMPALQGMGSKFGARICQGIVHFGFLEFDITKEKIICTPHIAVIESQRATVVSLA
jgi:hypothetical protein